MKICEFITKLMDMMQKYPSSIGWESDERTLSIKDRESLVENALEAYFRHKNLSSFVRQLNMYGFSKVNPSSSQYRFCHEIFRAGNEKNFGEIRRKQKEKSFREGEEKFMEKRKGLIDALERDERISKNMKGITLSLLLYKDLMKNAIGEMNPLLSQIYDQTIESRSSKLISSLQGFRDHHSNLQRQLLLHSRKIDKTANYYLMSINLKGSSKSEKIPGRPEAHDQRNQGGMEEASNAGLSSDGNISFQC